MKKVMLVLLSFALINASQAQAGRRQAKARKATTTPVTQSGAPVATGTTNGNTQTNNSGSASTSSSKKSGTFGNPNTTIKGPYVPSRQEQKWGNKIKKKLDKLPKKIEA